MYCRNCGQEIDDKAVICVHCGVPTGVPLTGGITQDIPVEEANEPPKKLNGLGIAGFCVSIVSLWLGVYFCIVSIVGLVLSIIAYNKRKNYTSCNAFALAGLIIGIVSAAFWGLMWMILGSSCAFTGCYYYY